ncbi:MAG: enoyl-CoA hydratase-related protein [Bacteroidetes bacterium]|nr:enoyl-CoA hydratase-related protein [Bacteroidota bacterium]
MELVQYEVKERVAYITLNRPEKRNALSFEFVQQIKVVFRKAEMDSDCKVIVIKANGEAFCSGADLASLQKLQTNTDEENLADSMHLMELYKMIHLSPKIVISQVEGAALAGGCGLASICDFCFATPLSKFAYTEVKIGFVPAIVMVFLIRKIGENNARSMMLTGDIIDANKALHFGLINVIVEADIIENEVFDFAKKLCKQTSSQSVALTKKMIAEVQNLSVDESLTYAANMNMIARKSDDCKKGISAFLNKEKLTW